MTKLLLSFIIFIIIHKSTQSPLLNLNLTGCSMQRSSNSVKVFLTISSITLATDARGIVKRQVELNWFGGRYSAGDRVGIYRKDPRLDPWIEPLASVDPTLYTSGFYSSSVEFPIVFFNISTISKDPCQGVWAAYRNSSGSVLTSSCLEIRPSWMKDNAKFLSNLSLAEIMIPGSHDSGSFYFHLEKNTIAKYKYAQEENIFNQLVYGLRYFDLRVGYYKKTKDKYYINHNFLRTQNSVRVVLKQVLEFLKSTKEIVILDFHNFPIGFDENSTHVELMTRIVKTFKPLMIPYKKKYMQATFRDLWAENKRVLISYDSDVRNKIFSYLLWPGITRAWGNKQYPEDLRKYFEDFFKNPTPTDLFASMAEITPNTRTIILHPESGLRIFAEKINRNVTHWFRDLYWKKANIVATDFFLGNNMIDVAVETNKIKGSCPKPTWKS